MSLTLALTVALITQTGGASTRAYDVDGSFQHFRLHWNRTVYPNQLLLEIDEATVDRINKTNVGKPTAAAFEPIQLHPTPADPNPGLFTMTDQDGDVVIDFSYNGDANIGYGSEAVSFGFQIGYALVDAMDPYSFLYFDYGAFMRIVLVPASGNTQDVHDVMTKNALSVEGSGTCGGPE